MILILRKFIILTILVFLLIGINSKQSFSQSATPTPSASDPQSDEKLNKLQDQIRELQNKISESQKQQKTLSSQITVMDSQIKLTELRINSVKQQVIQLVADIEIADKKISSLEDALGNLTKVLVNRIIATYEVGSSLQPLGILLSSANIPNFLTRANYLRIARDHDKELVIETQQAKNDYANQKEIFEEKKKKIESLKKQLETYTSQLDQEKKSKQQLLDITKGDEVNYQKLIAQAKAQLAAFSNFAQSQGGASILSNQTVCDDWGCYYNQRDSSWGGLALNGTQYTLASDGCLVTAMAMVYTHYGRRNVTPITINSDSKNFASYYAAWLKKDIYADGVYSVREGTDMDSVLASGHPVVVGISYDGGPLADHFVVFVSGSNGNYVMNDPFTPNGHNISFRDRYPNVKIVEVEKVRL